MGIFKIFNLLGLFEKTDISEVISELDALKNRLQGYAELYSALSGDPRVSNAIVATDLIIQTGKKLQDNNTSAEERIALIEKLKEVL